MYNDNMNDAAGHDPMIDPILQWFYSIPAITRSWFGVSALVTAAQTLDVIPASQLIFDVDRLFSPHMELWRILTSFAWAGPGTLMDFHVLILLYTITTVVGDYERDPHDASSRRRYDARPHRDQRRERDRQQHSKHARADCAFALLVCSLLILGSYLLLVENLFVRRTLHTYGVPFLCDLHPVFTRTLLYSIIALQSRRHPNANVNINFFPVPGRYVPLFHLVFSVMMGYRLHETLHGIAVGFVYDALVQKRGILERTLGVTRLLYTPAFFIDWLKIEGEAGGFDEQLVPMDLHDNDDDNDEPPLIPRLEPGAILLHAAAAAGDVAYLRREAESSTTVDALARFRKPDRNGWQPLHEAARSGHVEVIAFLVSPTNVARFGVNVNERTNGGRGGSALYLAEVEHGPDHAAAATLREAGAVRIDPGAPVREEPEEEAEVEHGPDHAAAAATLREAGAVRIDPGAPVREETEEED